MTSTEGSRGSNLPPPLQQQLDQACDRFEAAWRSDRPPDLATWLHGAAEPLRSRLLEELLRLDLAYRRQRGEEPVLDEYRKSLPDDDSALRRGFQPAEARTSAGTSLPAAGRAQVVLEVIEGPHQGCRFEFDSHQTFLAGRAETAQLRLADDPHFSRHHFLLELSPPRCYLRDLDSRNGTLVNGQRVKEAHLKHGDLISGGRTSIRVLCTGGAEQATQAYVTRSPGQAETMCHGGPRSGIAASGAPVAGRPARPSLPRVPGYELVREVGRGAMGVVYQARRSSTGEAVAVKLIMPHFVGDDRARQLFLREASLLSRLSHPRIVRFQEVGMVGQQFFFAMDYIEAVDLAEQLAGRSTTSQVKLVCGVACQVLEGLQFAHSQAIVHRDIKPSNILVSRHERRLRSHLADFGLAKNFENAGFSGMTREGEARGTVAYMPPEQIVNSRDVGPPVDLYAVGVMLYTLLTGESPYDFSTDRDSFLVVLEDEPIPLASRRPGVPAKLVALIHRALAKRPEARFVSAADMRKELLPFAKGRDG